MALGGGGARGVAHLGVMKAFEESPISIERVVGVSMGAMVGAVHATSPSIQDAQERVVEMLESPLFRAEQTRLNGSEAPTEAENAGSPFAWYERIKKVLAAHRRLTRAVTHASLISDATLRHAIEHLIPDVEIEDLQTPLSIVAVDLLSGHRVVLERGSLRKAVLASTAIPGIFPPVVWDKMLLCDLGVVESIPTALAQSYASDMTIAVDVSQDNMPIESCDTALDVMMRVDDICERFTRRSALDAADVVVRPNVGNVAWFDFSRPEKLIAAGYNAGIETLRHPIPK